MSRRVLPIEIGDTVEVANVNYNSSGDVSRRKEYRMLLGGRGKVTGIYIDDYNRHKPIFYQVEGAAGTNFHDSELKLIRKGSKPKDGRYWVYLFDKSDGKLIRFSKLAGVEFPANVPTGWLDTDRWEVKVRT
jgi:hypothetical protein